MDFYALGRGKKLSLLDGELPIMVRTAHASGRPKKNVRRPADPGSSPGATILFCEGWAFFSKDYAKMATLNSGGVVQA
jgi:hypothetical protein